MSRRNYSSIAQRTTLSGSITNSATSVPVSALTGWPGSYPFTIIVDPDTVNEEIMTVTAGAALNLTVTRGVGGTTGVSHSSGAVVQHGVYSADFDEANALVNLADAKGDMVAASAADTWAKVPAGSTGQILMADAASTPGVKWVSGGYTLSFHEEFAGTALPNYLTSTPNGSGSGLTNPVNGTYCQFSTGTTATGWVALHPSIATFSSPTSPHVWAVETYFGGFSALSDGTNTYQFLSGVLGAVGNGVAAQFEGAYFLYDSQGVASGSAASANWQCVTAASSTRTYTTTSVAASTSANTKLRVELDKSAAEARFYINGTLVATHTTNLTSASCRPAAQIIKSAGTTARTVFMDYYRFEWQR